MNVSLTDFISAGALLLSIYATLRAHSWKKEESAFLDLQSKVNALILEKEQREAAQIKLADLGANFIRLGNEKYRLKIFNKGKSAASDVDLSFPDGNDVIPEKIIRDKFPMELMEPGQSVELIAAPSFGSRQKFALLIRWNDSDGEMKEKTLYVTL